nr:hypothetical protein [Tanacetum cinerariifolium]
REWGEVLRSRKSSGGVVRSGERGCYRLAGKMEVNSTFETWEKMMGTVWGIYIVGPWG